MFLVCSSWNDIYKRALLCFIALYCFFIRCLAFGILEEAKGFIVPLILNFLLHALCFSFFCLFATCLSELIHNQAVGIVLAFLLMAVEFYFQKVHSIPGILLKGLGLSLTEPSRAVFGIGITICELALLCFVLISTADKRDLFQRGCGNYDAEEILLFRMAIRYCFPPLFISGSFESQQRDFGKR